MLRLFRVGLAVAALAAVLLAGGGVPPCALAASADTSSHAAALQNVPQALHKYYDGYWYFSTVADNPYQDWTPPKGKVQFCYNDSYQGNDWRAAALTEYKKLVAEYAKAGLANPNLIV